MSVSVSRSNSFSSRSCLALSGRGSAGGVHFPAIGGDGSRMSTFKVRSRAPTLYAGAGGFGTRISQPVAVFPMSAAFSETPLTSNDKLTMQFLNDRLAAYLDKVHSLEAANQKLELQIGEFCEKQSPVHSKDLTAYFGTMSDIREQLNGRLMENIGISLQLDNATLAADDFKMKCESEQNMCLDVERDVVRLRGILDNFTLSRSDLELQIEAMKEELVFLKKDHEEEILLVRSERHGAVRVKMDVAASADLNQELVEIRRQYEALVENIPGEAEDWFQGQVVALRTQMVTSTTESKASWSERGELKRSFQALEIEFQALRSQNQCLEQSVAGAGELLGVQLGGLQLRIDGLEAELGQLGAGARQQASDFQVLLGVKTRLELEIAEYRRLLGGEEPSSLEVSTTSQEVQQAEEEDEHNPHIQRRVKIITERIIDGEVVSSTVDEEVQEIQ